MMFGRGLRAGLVLVALVGVIGWIVWSQFGAERVRDMEDLQVGDCVRIPSGDFTDVIAVPAMSCDRPHNAELYLIGRLDRARERDYPGEDAARAEAIELCEGDELDEYLGPAAEGGELRGRVGSDLDVVVMWPSEVDWWPTRGAVYCFVRLLGDASTSSRIGEPTPLI